MGSLLFLVFFYPAFADYVLRTIPYSFLLLAPFGCDSIFRLAIALAVSFWAAHSLGCDEPFLYSLIKWLAAFVCGILLMHAGLVMFIVARGGL